MPSNSDPSNAPRPSQGWDNLRGSIARIAGQSVTVRTVLELATVQADLSLLTDNFGLTIPASDYVKDQRFTFLDPYETTNPTAVGDHGTHVHTVPRHLFLGPLLPGDRVLVAWVNEATDAVVVMRVVPGTA